MLSAPHKAAVIPVALVLGPDLFVRGSHYLSAPGTALAYLLSIAASVVLWLAAIRGLSGLRSRRPRVGRAVLVLCALVVSILTVSAIGYYARYEIDASPSVFAFFLRYPLYAAALAREASGWAEGAGFIVIPIAMVAAIELATRAAHTQPDRRRRLVELAAVGFLVTAIAVPRLPAVADIRGVATALGGAWQLITTRTGLPKPERLTIPELNATRRPDVVLFVHESLAAFQWHPWGCEQASCSPHIARLLGEHAGHTVWFEHAVSSASATDVSVPSMLSGLPPDGTRAQYAKAPLLWDYARKLGYTTALFTSQEYSISNFEEFLLEHDPPDKVMTAPDYGDHKRVNDNGVADSVMADAAAAWLAAAPTDKPVLLIVQFNSTHGPWWYPGVYEESPEPTAPVRYAGAARYVDEIAATIVNAVKARGRLEQTVMISTADHGENTGTSQPPRVENLNEAVARVPLWIHLPSALAETQPDLFARLQANRGARVGNIDILPTMLDLWGIWPLPAPLDSLPLAGHSLLTPIPADRQLVVSSTGEIRWWDREVFAIYYGHRKWLVDETGTYLFDVEADPHETQNLRDDVSEAERLRLLKDVIGRPTLLRILERLDLVLGKEAREMATP